MDVNAELDAPVPVDDLFAWVADLGTYPRWLEIVPRAVPDGSAPGDPGPAWTVDLRGRIGPFARSKRLRMVRTELVPATTATFERRERDGKHHSPWVLRARIEPAAPDGATSRLHMHLHYGGSLWVPVLERLLGDEIERSRPRLLACVRAGPPS